MSRTKEITDGVVSVIDGLAIADATASSTYAVTYEPGDIPSGEIKVDVTGGSVDYQPFNRSSSTKTMPVYIVISQSVNPNVESEIETAIGKAEEIADSIDSQSIETENYKCSFQEQEFDPVNDYGDLEQGLLQSTVVIRYLI